MDNLDGKAITNFFGHMGGNMVSNNLREDRDQSFHTGDLPL